MQYKVTYFNYNLIDVQEKKFSLYSEAKQFLDAHRNSIIAYNLYQLNPDKTWRWLNGGRA